MKKIFSVILTLALIFSIIPAYGLTLQVNAAGNYFLFPNEKYDKASARIVSSKYVTLTGTINGVVGSSISYKVEQITATSDKALNSTQDISTGITTTGDNQITVSNLELFAGLNKITFKGVAGTSTVEESVYIEFRDSPMLNDLKILFENRSYDVLENGVTMLYSQSQTSSRTGVITIDGYAPNATKVTVEINNYSYDFNVSQTSNTFRFSTSQLTINKGMNTITFKVTNGGQVIETTRQVALYNGEVTYFDEKLENSGTKYDLSSNGNYSVNNANATKITGKAIIPLPLYDLANNGSTPVSNTDMNAISNALAANMSINVSGLATNPVINILSLDPSTLTASSEYVTVAYEYEIPGNSLALNTAITFTLRAPNLTQYDTSDARRFTLRDGTKAYIADINYLSGFDDMMTSNHASNSSLSVTNNPNQIRALQGTDIPAAGVEVYSIPMAVELLIANASSLGPSASSIPSQLEVNINGVNYTFKVIADTSGDPVTETVTRTVDGVDVSYLRMFLEFDKLEKAGTNTMGIKFNNSANAITETKYAIFKLQYGPYVKFDSIVNGMSVSYDSYKDSTLDLVRRIGALTGRLMNVANPKDIVYKTENGNKQSVFLYLNNVEIPISSYDPTGAPNSSLFAPIGVTINSNGAIQSITNDLSSTLAAIMNKAGENTVKFVFRTGTYSYESIIKFSIVPANLPVVPAPNTDGVYPYSLNQWPPRSTDSKFTYSDGIYTTREAEFNVYGTFDFIDLGTSESQIRNSLSNNQLTKSDYIVQITNPDWNSRVQWDLSKELKITNGQREVQQLVGTNTDIVIGNGSASTPDANITFYYDQDNENFFFNITNQKMPEDGSPLVYVITVFNAGESGPRATYRLEVNPISIPYSIKSPVEEKRIVNQNFVEVIIAAPGAESITINKQAAEPIDYYDYGTGPTATIKAFRTVVTNLKANGDTVISFTIKRGETTTTDKFTVKYVPTNIPGAQYMETMKSSHKVFNNSLTLTFPKSTNLIRPTYNQSNDSATQVYSNHSILFSIANPDDGIVDRHMFESQAPDYSANSQATGELHIKTRFENYANRFIKASPLYWIDAGLADDPEPTSPQYDPVTRGLDPFPFPSYVGVEDYPNFAERYGLTGRELVPSNVGSLTLNYDNSIVQSAGTTITVFRFDPYASTWENIGGVVDEKKGTVTVPFSKFGYYVVVKLTRSYNDIIDHSYAREAMEAIYAKGVMNAADPVNRFGGDEYITRGEFTRMIVRALDLPLSYSGNLHFTYYPETITNASNSNAIYDYRYIETAARAGIVNGTRPGFFGEDVSITRQDASVILARALELKLETNATKARQQLDKAFKDGANFDYYAIPAVLAIQKQGFIVGKPLNTADPKAGYIFDPKARMLRSDAAIIMARVMKNLKKLPQIYG